MITKDTVYQLLKDKISSPISFMELATQLRLDSPGKRATKKILRALVSEGQIVRTRRGLYGLAEEMSLITGYFEAHRDGYGFVILDKPESGMSSFPPGRLLGQWIMTAWSPEWRTAAKGRADHQDTRKGMRESCRNIREGKGCLFRQAEKQGGSLRSLHFPRRHRTGRGR